MDKKITRNCAKHIRSLLDIQNISSLLVEKIQTLGIYNQANNILLYYPKKGELDFTELANNPQKKFYLPRLEDNNIVCCLWEPLDELKLSKYSIYEPCTNPTSINNIDLIILPGLCADIQKNRLGYGKGCYDKLLTESRATTIFPIPDELLFERIPTDTHDQKADIIITPTKIIQ